MTQGLHAAFIVDSDPNGRHSLRDLIDRFCPELYVCGEASGITEALDRIPQLQPELLFLDIRLTDGSSFELLESLPDAERYSVIFVTALESQAVRAFRATALDYLLKPLSGLDLARAVGRFLEGRPAHSGKEFGPYRPSAGTAPAEAKVVVPTLSGFSLIRSNDILRIEADSGYTRIHLLSGETALSVRSLLHYEETLSAHGFVRVHHKHMVNLRYVDRYLKGRGGTVVMRDGSRVNVSVRRREEFLRLVARYTRGL